MTTPYENKTKQEQPPPNLDLTSSFNNNNKHFDLTSSYIKAYFDLTCGNFGTFPTVLTDIYFQSWKP